MSIPIMIRPMVPLDRPIVADSWARTFVGRATRTGPLGERWVSVEDGPEVGKSFLAPNLLHAAIRWTIDDLLERSQVLVGHVVEERAVVLCWCAFEPGSGHTTMHYLWTRSQVRLRGYASALVQAVECLGQPGAPLRPSHMTKAGQAFNRSYKLRARAA